MSRTHIIELSEAYPVAHLRAVHPDGRELLISVCLPALPEVPTSIDPDDHAFVVYVDTDEDGAGSSWEPSPETLRVNVNDGSQPVHPGRPGPTPPTTSC